MAVLAVTVALAVELRRRWPVFGTGPDDGGVVRRGQRPVVPLLAGEEPIDKLLQSSAAETKPPLGLRWR